MQTFPASPEVANQRSNAKPCGGKVRIDESAKKGRTYTAELTAIAPLPAPAQPGFSPPINCRTLDCSGLRFSEAGIDT